MKSTINSYEYIETYRNIYDQRCPASDEDAALAESRGLDIDQLYELASGICAEIDYEYGDLNEDGFTYCELADGTNWLCDDNATWRVPRKIRHPESLRWSERCGLTHGNGRPVEMEEMTPQAILDFYGWGNEE